jgi:hypothetical protein
VAGRPKGSGAGTKLSQSHRDKIANSNILSHLISHAEGTREMTSTQVTAAIALLKKCLPDLQAVQHTGNEGGPVKIEIGWIKD